MTVEARQMLQKINFIESSRLLKRTGAIEEYLPIPKTVLEEKETVKELLFRYLKHRFRGCRIRTNALSFSIRLDGEVHRKSQFIRDTIWADRKWRDFLQNEHAPLARIIGNGQNAFTNDFDLQTRDTHRFIHIPLQIERIRDYAAGGLKPIIDQVENSYRRDLSIFEAYEQIMNAVNTEIARQEEEQRQKLLREKAAYFQSVQPRLYQDLRTNVEFDSHTVEGKLAQKMSDWCRERNIRPALANEPTASNVVPIGTKVRVVAQKDSNEENWYAVPLFDGFAIPENYEQKPGWGKVTKYDAASARSRHGVAPLVVEEYLYLGFDFTYWTHVLPEGYLDALEATRRFRQEAEKECAEEQCDEATVQDILQAEQTEEAEGVAPAREDVPQTQAPVQSLVDTLRAQVTQAVVPIPEAPVEEEQAEGAEPGEIIPVEVVTVDPETRVNGIYYNALAIPLERYVLKIDGVIKRFSSLVRVNHYIEDETLYTTQVMPFHVVRNWDNPDVIYERNEN